MELVRLSALQRLVRAWPWASRSRSPCCRCSGSSRSPFARAARRVYPISILPTSLTLDNITGVLFGTNGIGLGPYRNAAFYGLSVGRDHRGRLDARRLRPGALQHEVRRGAPDRDPRPELPAVGVAGSCPSSSSCRPPGCTAPPRP